MEEYINISKASSSSLVERVSVNTTLNSFVAINKIAEIKGLKSNLSLRIAIQKGKYIAHKITVPGGESYEILYSSLEPEVQEKLEDESIKSTALVPINNDFKTTFICESAKLTALARVDIIESLLNYRERYKTNKEADAIFLDLYNSDMLLPTIYKYMGNVSVSSLHRWLNNYKKTRTYTSLLSQYKYSKLGEYNSILNNEMKQIFLKFLLHPNKFSVGKAINLTIEILKKRG